MSIAVAICIATHNRREDLARTLKEISKLDPAPDALLICADGCDDGTAEMVRAAAPHARLIEHATAQGSVASRNELAEICGCEVFVNLDDDSYPLDRDFIPRLRELFERRPCLAVASFPQRTDEFPESLAEVEFGQSLFVGTFANSSVAIRRSAFQEMGGYAAFFFHAYEEPDFTVRSVCAGWQVRFETSLTVRHHYTGVQRNELRTHQRHARNEIWSVFLRCPAPQCFAVAIFRALRQAVYASRRGGAWLLREPAWWMACIRGLPRCFAQRRPLPWRRYLGWMRLVRKPISDEKTWDRIFGKDAPAKEGGRPARLSLDEKGSPGVAAPRGCSDEAGASLAVESPGQPKVIVAQDGARLHYAAPLALQARGALDRMFVEVYVKPGSPMTLAAWAFERAGKSAGKRMRERHHPDLDAGKIRTNPMLAWRQAMARRRFATAEEFFAWGSDLVGEWILREGINRRGGANALFGFVRNISPKLCEAARARGFKVVADQMIAPMVEERWQADDQASRFPDWQATIDPCNHALVERVEAETWSNCDHLTCGSPYVRDCLIKAGQPASKITVLPYPIDAASYRVPDRKGRSGPVTVGFLGSVGLRKGSPYFVEAARRLAGCGVRFVMVGPITVDKDLLTGVDAVGSVPRSEARLWLEKFDIIFFPSTCEGSSGAVMEALAMGLPVVTTPNSGTVVRHAEEGFVHPCADLEALTASVDRLISDARLRSEMARAARKRAEEFNLEWYSQELTETFRTQIASPQV